MKRFKNILLVSGQVNDNRTTLERATDLAKRNGACLTVVEAVEGLPRDVHEQVRGISPQELEACFVRERQKQLQQLIAPIAEQGIQLTINVLIGTPFIEII